MTDDAFDLTYLLDILDIDKTSLGYRFEIDGSEFSITEDGLGCYVLLGSVVRDRTASMIEYKLPCRVANREQGLALLAYPLRNLRFANTPGWLIEGQALSNHLPWNAQGRDNHDTSQRD